MKCQNYINPKWPAYDQAVGKCQLSNYGIIFLDQYGMPIDNEYTTEELFEKLQELIRQKANEGRS